MGKMWIEEHLIYSNDIDYKAECRLSTLLSLMQRAADGDIEHLGGTRDQLIEHDMGWMLTTIQLELEQMPKFNDVMKIRTWNKGTKGPLWMRDFQIVDKNEVEIASSRTLWALVDIKKRKVLRPASYPFEIEANLEDSMGPIPHKMDISVEVELYTAYLMTVSYSGIDSNGHLNNSRYADLCMDALTESELDRISILGFHITYYHEAKRGEQIQVLRSDDLEGYIYFRGQSLENERYFDACLHVGSNKDVTSIGK